MREIDDHAQRDQPVDEPAAELQIVQVQNHDGAMLLGSTPILAADGWDVVLIAIKDADTAALEDRGDYVVKRVELRSRRLPRWTRPLRFFEAIAKTFRAAYREDADVCAVRPDLLVVQHHVAHQPDEVRPQRPQGGRLPRQPQPRQRARRISQVPRATAAAWIRKRIMKR